MARAFLNFREKKTAIEVKEKGNMRAEIYEWPKASSFDVVGFMNDEVVMYSSAMTLEHDKSFAKHFVEGTI